LLDFVSDVTARPPINGDLRVALDLLLYSSMLAEREGYDRVLPEHVRRVLGETHPSITTEGILYLSDARSKVQAALNAYRDYIQRSVNAGLTDAGATLEPALKLVDGLLGAEQDALSPTIRENVIGSPLAEARDLHDLPQALGLMISQGCQNKIPRPCHSPRLTRKRTKTVNINLLAK
jgi:hypothetical protein